MFKQLNISIIRNVFNLAKNCRAQRFSSTTSTPEGTEANDTQFKHPSRPAWLEGQKLTDVVESKEEFEKYVKKILPDFTIPEPPAHKSYPTPSGWVPPDYKKASQLPYFVLRSRFHQFPIYPEERDGSKRYVRIRNIEGNIWQFEKDLRKHIEECIETNEGKKENVYAQVNEIQRQVLVKGYYQEYINEFFIKCGF